MLDVMVKLFQSVFIIAHYILYGKRSQLQLIPWDICNVDIIKIIFNDLIEKIPIIDLFKIGPSNN